MDRGELEAVRTIVAHDSCADGTASAMLLHDALPDAEVVFADYGDAKGLEATPNMLFCDFSPPAARADEFAAVGTIVLDHHRSARAVVEKFGARGIFADETADPGVSGAVLAYRHVWRVMHADRDPTFAESFSTAAGARDTWQTSHASWRDGCVQHAVLLAFPQQFWLTMPFASLATDWHDRYAWIGEQLIVKAMDRVEQAHRDAHRFTSATGVRVLAIPGHAIVSDLTERAGDEVDLVMAFGFGMAHGALAMFISLRSRGRFDCAGFAQRHGGGGHTNAAGFAIALRPTDPQPYVLIERLLD